MVDLERIGSGQNEVPAVVPPRSEQSHGSIALDPAACTACNLCVTDCPAWCITLSSRTQRVEGPGRGRATKVLESFTIDYGLCMFCGICVDVCPFDALAWAAEPVEPALEPTSLIEDREQLAQRWPEP